MDITIHASFLPHNDPDASLAFYRDTLGFEVRNDVGYGGMRWLTVGPADQPTSIVLHPPAADPGITDEERRTIAEMMAKGTYAALLLATADLDGAFARLQARRRGRPGADRAAVRRSRLRLPRSRGQHDPHPGAALSRPPVARREESATKGASMSALDRLVGTWEYTMHHSAMSEPVTGRQRYERVLDGAFVLQRWTYDHPDFPDAIALLSDDRYHYFDVRGITRVFELEVDDAGWSMVRLDVDFSQRYTARFRGPDVMESTGEMSHDNGVTWQPDFTITYQRVE